MRPRRIDTNQRAVAEAFLNLGCSVFSTAPLGRGFPDLAVGVGGHTILVEVKDGSKPRRQRDLTTPQQKFRDNWRGSVFYVESVTEVPGIVNAYRRQMEKL